MNSKKQKIAILNLNNVKKHEFKNLQKKYFLECLTMSALIQKLFFLFKYFLQQRLLSAQNAQKPIKMSSGNHQNFAGSQNKVLLQNANIIYVNNAEKYKI
eukprot:TRINITY_DN10377_c0_g1_i1.p5 TRINITY_DN10377_c0_g1~~TRINITY_DN10377_c0_g1_i1.p5  ORF type:complete len:100 (+),score=15.63 TRINITY_DN10377_c0_g1_i1:395-694(+)